MIGTQKKSQNNEMILKRNLFVWCVVSQGDLFNIIIRIRANITSSPCEPKKVSDAVTGVESTVIAPKGSLS